MTARLVAFATLALLATPALSIAQSSGPVPLYPGPIPRTYEAQPLAPLGPANEPPPARTGNPPAISSGPAMAPAPAATTAGSPAEREFCTQAVSLRLADREAIPERFRPFVGIWSDASWTPQVCATLVVENVTPDGTATIVYVFGPMGSAARAAGGVLHGTGIIRDGELRFQNSDGSQYAFRPLYSDLDGRLTTPQGQTYGAIFKKAL